MYFQHIHLLSPKPSLLSQLFVHCFLKPIKSNLCYLYTPEFVAIPWNMVHLPGTTPSKKTDSPSLIALQLRVGFYAHIPSPCRFLWVELARGCVCQSQLLSSYVTLLLCRDNYFILVAHCFWHLKYFCPLSRSGAQVFMVVSLVVF